MEQTADRGSEVILSFSQIICAPWKGWNAIFKKLKCPLQIYKTKHRT